MTALLLACTAYAQTATIPQPSSPTIATPSAPTVAPVTATTTPMSNAPAPTNDVMQQLQKIMGKKDTQDSVGKVLVIGSILGCTQKTAGKEATNAFYQQMQAVGKQAEAYCKQNQPAQARALVLRTFKTKKNDPVVKAALNCYDTQKASLDAMAGERMAADMANYANWLRNPDQAEAIVKDNDICRGKPPTSTMPVTQ